VQEIPEMPVQTHVDFKLSRNVVNLGKLKKCPEVFPSEYVDIHNIAGKHLSIFS
jgi:hypothetical protein